TSTSASRRRRGRSSRTPRNGSDGRSRRVLLRSRVLTAAAVFTIWVSESELAAPSTTAMAQAAREMLGAEVRLQTQAFPDGHPDTVPAPGAGERTALLSWDSTLHSHALLRLCRRVNDCVERWVAFDVSDPELERGRTLGFLAATVFLDTAAPPVQQP